VAFGHSVGGDCGVLKVNGHFGDAQRKWSVMRGGKNNFSWPSRKSVQKKNFLPNAKNQSIKSNATRTRSIKK
jgi:hypothetical protein